MFIFWYLELNIFLKIYLHAFWHFCVRTMQRNKSYLKIGEFIVLYVRKGQTSEIVFVLNTPNGWLFTNRFIIYSYLWINSEEKLMNWKAWTLREKMDINQIKQTSSPTYYHVFWDLWEDYTDKPSFSHYEKYSQTEHELVTLKKRK